MSIQAQTPDGVIHQFPDGTPDAAVDKAIKDYLSATPQPAPVKENVFQKALRIAGEQAGAASDAFKADVQKANRTNNPIDQVRPVLDAFNGTIGAVVKGVGDATFGDKPLHLPEKVMGVAVPDWAQNINSKGLTPGDIAAFAIPVAAEAKGAASINQFAKGAGITARTAENTLAASRAAPVADAASPSVNALAPKPAPSADPLSGAGNLLRKAPVAPDIQALQATKSAAYKAVDDAGVQYAPAAVQKMVGDVAGELDKANISPLIHPKASAVLSKLQDLAHNGQPPTLTELDQMRQFVRRDLMDPKNSDGEQFMGRKIIDGIDQLVDGAKPADLISGDPQQAAQLIGAARRANTIYRKAESIQDAVASARLRAGSTGSGGNVENATRQAIRQQLEKMPGLTDDEQDAMRQIVLGTPAQNSARLAGKLSPQGNGLMATMSLSETALGGMFGGTHGAAAGAVPAAVGMVAKTVSDAMAARKVNALLRLVAAGGDKDAVAAALAEPQTGTWAVRITAAGGKSPHALSSAVGRLGAAAKANPALVPLYLESQKLLPAPARAAATPTSPQEETQ